MTATTSTGRDAVKRGFRDEPFSPARRRHHSIGFWVAALAFLVNSEFSCRRC
jgi:hypothetical protein